MDEEGEEFEGSEVFDFDELAQLFIEAVDNDDEDLLKTTIATAIDNNVSLQDLFDCEDMVRELGKRNEESCSFILEYKGWVYSDGNRQDAVDAAVAAGVRYCSRPV